MTVETKLWSYLHMEAREQGRAVEEAAAMLKQGGVVAFPTETVYGLGADARSTEAVERIFAAKGRPSDNPLIVHIARMEQIEALAMHVSDVEKRLMERFWPGPLTLVLPLRQGAVSPRVTAGLDTVGVRMPDHDLALKLIAAAGVPLAAPSANRSTRPSPTTAQHVMEDLDGRIAGVLDGGAAGIGLESTVVRVDSGGARIHVLRPGGVTASQLQAAAPEAVVVAADAAAVEAESIPRSPGMKYAHYAPKGRLTVVRSANPGEPGRIARYIREELERLRAAGETTGVLSFTATDYLADIVARCGTLEQPEEAARLLYAALRRFDEAGATVILAESVPEEGLGQAIMNRLRKAAAGRIIEV
jgi:L-threonylcarbamoyladenylate synthase